MAIGTTAAIIGASAIGAGASILSGNKAAKAQKQGADQAAASAREANDLQRYMYDTARSDYAPAREVGTGALYKLAAMYGVTPQPTAASSSGGVAGNYGFDASAYLRDNPDVLQGYHDTADKTRFPSPTDYAQWHYQNFGIAEGRQAPISQEAQAAQAARAADASQPYGGFETSPGYKFRVDEAMKAIERSAAARGSLRSGATMDALQRRVQGVASDEYENYANRLAQLAGLGQNATSGTTSAGANYASGANQNLNAQGNAAMAAGNARASAYANTGNAINQGVQNLTSAYLYNQGYGGGGGFGGGGNTPWYGNA